MRHLAFYFLAFCLVSTTLFALTAPQHATAQEPILHWTFDEPSGDVIDHGIGEPANGVFQATATRIEATPGGFSPFALDLRTEGLESWVLGPDAEKVDTLESFTLSTWLYLEDWNTGGSGNQRLIAKQAPDPWNGFSWNLNGSPNDGELGADNFRLGLFVGGDGFEGTPAFGADFSTEDVDADGKWTFLAVTYDGETADPEENVRFYVGDESTGVSQLGEARDMLSGPVLSSAGLATVNVGYTDATPGVDYAVNGFQDDVRIYGQVLTLEDLEVVRLANLQSTLEGDFNGDDVRDATDIDLLSAEIRANGSALLFDVNGDGDVTAADRNMWVRELQRTWFGDSNLDGEFNSGDFVSVFSQGLYEMPQLAGWASGDWNGDGQFDSSDFVTAFTDGGYELGLRPAVQAVPEPAALTLMGMALMLLVRRNRW